MTPAPAELSLAALVLSFTGGIIMGVNPCCFAMIPAIFGYLGGYCEPSWRRCSWLSLWLGAGIVGATVLLGLPVMLFGGLFGVQHPLVRYSLPLVPIAMGLHLLGIIQLRMPKVSLPRLVGNGAAGAFFSGLVFSLAILPCATPVLASILSYAIAQDRPIDGSVLLFAYGSGLALPLMGTGLVFGSVSALNAVASWWPTVHRVSGAVLMALGFYLLWQA